MIGKSREQRQAGVTAAVARFKQMLDNAPEHMPRIMPMTAAIAPTFAARYPEASIIFDNLHAMHDVVSDILANNEKVPRDRKRAAILEAASRYRDATSFPMSMAEWKSMGEMMGIENMGGPAVGFLAGWPTPTLARGASMAEAMKGMKHGAPGAMAGMPGMAHGGDSAAAKSGMPAMPGMSHGAGAAGGDSSSAMMPQMMEMHERMMRDPVIRERIMADTAMRRMMTQMDAMHGGMQHDMKDMDMPGKASKAMPGMKHDAAPAAEHAHTPSANARATVKTKSAATASRKRTTSRATPTARKVTPAKKPAPTKAAPPKPAPMDHSKMPGMKMPGMKP